MLARKSQAWGSDPRRVGLEEGDSLVNRLSAEGLGVPSLMTVLENSQHHQHPSVSVKAGRVW